MKTNVSRMQNRKDALSMDNETCRNCGLTLGSHLKPGRKCPDQEGVVDYETSATTSFMGTRAFMRIPRGTFGRMYVRPEVQSHVE